MRHKIWNFFNTKKSLLSGVLFTFLMFTTLFIQSLSTDIKQLSVLQEGMGTCFARVGQSFTSKIMGIGPQYLRGEFLTNTEECLGDVIEIAENSLEALFSSNLKRLNSFSSDLHWFHERLEGKGEASLINNPKEVINESIITRFEKLEQLKDEILAVNSELMNGLESSLSTSKIAFYLLTFFLPLFMFWDYLEKKGKRVKNQEIDQRAHEVLMEEGTSKRQEVERILKRAFDHNELKYCAKLFSNYQSYYESYMLDHGVKSLEIPKKRVVYLEENDFNDKVNELWESDIEDTYEGDLGAISVQKVFNQVVDAFSATLQGHGIILNININAEDMVYAEEESLEQVLYHSLNESVSACLKNNQASRINITSTSLGGSYILEVSHNGVGYDKELLNAESGLVPQSLQEYLGVGLQISYSFMQEFDGKIDFENIISKDKQIVGAKQRLIFHAVKVAKEASQSGANLVSLKVGKKSEILKQISGNA